MGSCHAAPAAPLALVAAVLASVARPAPGQASACYKSDMGYVDGSMTDSLPNAGFWPSPSMCQVQCQGRGPYCTYWTWRRDGDGSRSLGPGGCWVLSETATLQPMAGATAGPQNCLSDNESRGASALSSAAPVVSTSTATALASMSTVSPTVPASVASSSSDSPGAVNSSNASIAPLPGFLASTPEAPEVDTAGSSQGGGFPWWFALIAALALASVLAALLLCKFAGSEGDHKAPARRRKTRSSNLQDLPPELPNSRCDEETYEEVTAPLIHSEAEAPVNEAERVPAGPLPQYTPLAQSTAGFPQAPAMRAPGYSMPTRPTPNLVVPGMPQRVQLVQPVAMYPAAVRGVQPRVSIRP